MRLALQPTHEALAAEISKAIDDDISVARAAEMTAEPNAVWKTIRVKGWCRFGPPENGVELTLLYKRLGRAQWSTPHWASCVMARNLVQGSDGGTLKELDSQLADGSLVATVGLTEPGFGGFVNWQCEIADGRVRGAKILVPNVGDADLFLVGVRGGDGQRMVAAIKADDKNVIVKQQGTIVSRGYSSVLFDGARAEAVASISDSAFHRALLPAAVALSASASGLADSALAHTVSYVKKRYAFDRPIGSYQAIQHALADISTSVAAANTISLHAGWSVAHDIDAERATSSAFLFATNTARHSADRAVQYQGGHGFSEASGMPFLYRHAKDLQLALGGSPLWESLLVDRVRATLELQGVS